MMWRNGTLAFDHSVMAVARTASVLLGRSSAKRDFFHHCCKCIYSEKAVLVTDHIQFFGFRRRSLEKFRDKLTRAVLS